MEDFEKFCEREFPHLVGALSILCGDRDVAEDLAQEALARAYRDWRRVSRLDRPGAWTRRVAMNLARSNFRRWQAERRAYSRYSGRAKVTGGDSDAADAIAVREAVLALSKDQRSVLVLRYFFDMPINEAAETLGRSPSAITSLTHRAIATLREALADDPLSTKETS